jgi:hypothetical protein
VPRTSIGPELSGAVQLTSAEGEAVGDAVAGVVAALVVVAVSSRLLEDEVWPGLAYAPAMAKHCEEYVSGIVQAPGLTPKEQSTKHLEPAGHWASVAQGVVLQLTELLWHTPEPVGPGKHSQPILAGH